MLTALLAGQSLVPLFIDLNRLRAIASSEQVYVWSRLVRKRLNPALAGIVEVAFIWWPGPALSQRFYLVSVLAAIPIVVFFVSQFSRRLREILEDPNRPPRSRISVFGKVVKFNIYVVLVPIAAILLVGAIYFY